MATEGHDFANDARAQEARMAKATRLETRLAAEGFTSEQVRHFTPDDRSWYERVTGVHKGSDKTWALVADLLASAEASPARQ